MKAKILSLEEIENKYKTKQYDEVLDKWITIYHDDTRRDYTHIPMRMLGKEIEIEEDDPDLPFVYEFDTGLCIGRTVITKLK